MNCGGEHAASDRNCPQWILEKDIQKIKAQQNISYKEAKNQAMANRTSSSRSYAEAAQSSPQSCSQQSPAIVDVLQTVIKQMEQLQKQLHIMSKRVGVNIEEETTGENFQNPKPKKQQMKRSLTRNEATSSNEELTAKRRSVETKGDAMAETDFTDEDMTKVAHN